MNDLIRLEDVSMEYRNDGEGVHALRGVTLAIGKGDFAVVTGESGSGKSTLLTLLGGLAVATGGTVAIRGIDPAGLSADALADFRRETIGFVFQAYHLLPYLTARENVMVPMAPMALPGPEKARKADDLLASVGLAGKSERLPSQLSGGECQRVAIARALVQDPILLLADEPTGNLDHATGEQILDLFSELHRAGRTVVMVTHNEANVARGTCAIRMRDGGVDSERRLAVS